jgi:hypothetical protein
MLEHLSSRDLLQQTPQRACVGALELALPGASEERPKHRLSDVLRVFSPPQATIHFPFHELAYMGPEPAVQVLFSPGFSQPQSAEEAVFARSGSLFGACLGHG